MLHRRHFTVEQANRVLPAVRSIVHRLRKARGRQAVRGFDTELAREAELTGGTYPGRGRARDAIEVALGMDELERLGLVVRDVDRGLVDFPAFVAGREVYLCWLDDEPAVAHWHEIEAGFRGRRPLWIDRFSRS